MPSNRLLCDTVTLFNYAGEVNYKATYFKTFLKRVFFDDSYGARQNNTGKVPDDAARLYIFDSKVIATSESGEKKEYIPHDKWISLTDKSNYWTLSPNEEDFIVPGFTDTSTPDEAQKAFCVKKIHEYYRGSKRIWHTEVDAV